MHHVVVKRATYYAAIIYRQQLLYGYERVVFSVFAVLSVLPVFAWYSTQCAQIRPFGTPAWSKPKVSVISSNVHGVVLNVYIINDAPACNDCYPAWVAVAARVGQIMPVHRLREIYLCRRGIVGYCRAVYLQVECCTDIYCRIFPPARGVVKHKQVASRKVEGGKIGINTLRSGKPYNITVGCAWVGVGCRKACKRPACTNIVYRR